MICPFMSGPSGTGGKTTVECVCGRCALWVVRRQEAYDEERVLNVGETHACAAAFMAVTQDGRWTLNAG